MRKLIVVVSVATVALSSGLGHAGTREAVYVANGLQPVGAITTSPAPLTVFPPDGKIPRSITITDAAGRDIAIDVCQNVSDADDFVCGEGDVVYSFCAEGAGAPKTLPSTLGWRNAETTVYVNLVSETAISATCDGVATAGTIALVTS